METYACKKCGEELILDDIESWDELACPGCSEVLPPEVWARLKPRGANPEIRLAAHPFSVTPPCPQCARFREKLYREKMEEVFRCCDGIDVYSPEALADKMIRYLTE